jgi:hypothetical protein
MWLWVAAALGQQAQEGVDEPVDETEAPEEAIDVPPPTPAPPVVIEIPAYTIDKGLGGFDQEVRAYDDEGFEGIDLDWAAPPDLIRGKWYVRPVVGYSQLRGPAAQGGAVRVGANVGRQWFLTGDSPVQGGGNIGLVATAPIGQATGFLVHGEALAGPWLGPVGLRVGPTLKVERESWVQGDALLDTALLVGGRAVLTVDAGVLKPFVEVEPNAVVAGERASVPSPVLLPVLGTETTYGAGLGLHTGWLYMTGKVHWRETAVGRLLDVGVGITLRPGGG